MIRLNETRLREVVRATVRRRLEEDRDRRDSERDETVKLTRKQLENVVNEEYARAKGKLTEDWDDGPVGGGSPSSTRTPATEDAISGAQLTELIGMFVVELATTMTGHLGPDAMDQFEGILDLAVNDAVGEAIRDFELSHDIEILR